MLNKLAKKSVLVFSVVLLTVPFAGSVYAQNNTASSQILFEMQAMRAEIADLRDMVERQQFELKKLKQRNTQLESLQKESQANVEAQIQQLQQNSRLAQPNIDYDNPYGTYSDQQANILVDGSSQDLQNTPVASATSNSAQVTPVLQSNEGNSDTPLADGQTLKSPLNVDGRSPIDQVDQQQVMATAQEATSDAIDNTNTGLQEATSQVADQAQTNQGPEIVERGFDSAELNRPVSQIGEAIEQSDASQETAVVQEGTADLEGVTSSSLGGDAVRSANPVVDTTPNTNANTSSPILSVPNLETTSDANAKPIDAGQIPQAPIEANGSADLASAENQIIETPKPVQLTEDQHYDQGFEYLKQSKYDEAISTFNQQIELYPTGDLADDAHYWIAEAYFISRKSAEAKPHLKAIIDNYPTSARLPDAMLKTAYIEQDMGNMIEARILLQEIVARHPSSNAAIAARNRLENLSTSN